MKKALLIGINYRGTSGELRGCINDVLTAQDYLLERDYDVDDITILTDNTRVKPTKNNIIKAILALVQSGARELFMHYSGHGSWEVDNSGDEEDGRDESLVPLDYKTAGNIKDDQLCGLLSFMKPGVNLTIVLDCCHSGTGMDLPYNLCTRKNICGERFIMKRSNKTVIPGSVVMISGCLDKQYSADAYEEAKFQGALTYCLYNLLEHGDYTWEELVRALRKMLKDHKYEQIPTLSCNTKLNLKNKCTLH